MRTGIATAPIPGSFVPLCEVYEETCVSHTFLHGREKIYPVPAIGFVLSGWFDYRAQGGAITGVPGTLIFANAGERFHCRHKDTLGNRRLVARFSQTFLEDVAQDRGLPDADFRCAALPPGKIPMEMFGWMLRLDSTFHQEEAACALAVMALSIAPDARGVEPISPRNRQRIFVAIRHIEEFYAEPCGLEMLAALVGLSRYRFLHLFKTVTGQSPNRYIIDMRLRAAAERLLTTKAPVSQIAFDVGFNDISHFNASFRVLFGCPPRQWRNAA